MTYSIERSEEGLGYLASGLSRKRVLVAVRLLETDWVPDPGESAARTFTTARGYRGHSPETPLPPEARKAAKGRGLDTVILVLLGRARVAVTIVASGRGAEAGRLARAVESLVLSGDAPAGRGGPGKPVSRTERPRVDGRLAGCYTRVADTASCCHAWVLCR